ncbi:MAG: hypothetical protein RL007_346, partial [Bacteroidota bacterium]|jgi:hypothetical protein
MYLAGGKYLWRNNDLSQIPVDNQWDSISTNWVRWNDSVPQANVFISALHVCKTPANRVYYGTDKKRVFRVDNANTGTPTPVEVSPTNFPQNGFVSCITTNLNDSNEVLVAFSNYSTYSIYQSTDAGATWVKAAGNLEATTSGGGNGPSVRWLSVIPVSDGKVYLAATSTGLYATDTLMGTSTVWVRQGENTIGAVVCDMIDYRESDGTVVLATHANGIYSSTITTVNDIVTVPENYNSVIAMSLNVYPNPATDQVNITYTLPKNGDAEILLIDELGRIIESQKRNNLTAGEQRAQFNLSNCSAGVYYVRLQSGTLTESRVLIRQ